MNWGTEIPQDESARVGLLDRTTVPWHVGLGAAAQDAFVHNPLTQAFSSMELFMARNPWARGAFGGGADAPPQYVPQDQSDGDADTFIDPKTLNSQYGQSHGLTFDQPQRKGAVAIMVRRKAEEIDRQAKLQRAPSGIGYGLASLATQLAVSATDPINIASAFIPVVGEARGALWTARYGKTAGRALTGVVEGTVGAAAVDPLNYTAAQYLGDDYGMGDSLLNIALGGALGGGLHVGFGKISDRLNRLAPETREGALRGAIANMAEGREIDIDHILMADPRFTAPVGAADDGTITIARPFSDAPSLEPTQADIESAAADIANARAPLPKDRSLFQAIKEMGGLRLRNEAGDITREGAEVQAVLKDIKRPGLVNNKTGITPDYLREGLRERGWFGVREDQGADLQNLYDMLGREAKGEKIYHPESEIHGHIAAKAAADEEFARAGITAKDSPEVAARKLAQWRVAQAENEGSALKYWRQKADEYGVEYRGSDGPEDLMAAVTEAEAIRAERNGDLEGFADRAEARLREHMDRLYPDLKDEDLERQFKAQSQRDAFGEFEGEGQDGFSQDPGGFGRDDQGTGSGRQSAAASLDSARTRSEAFARGQEQSSAVPANSSERGDAIIKEAQGDDLDAEHAEAMAQIDALEAQGALTPAEAEAGRGGADDLKKARAEGKAAKTAARCLLLHP